MEWSVETASPEETQALGELLGTLLEPPAVLLLHGDLGTGKTCLTQGLARGLGVPEADPVTSPSYTLLNIHQGRCPLHHFDLYRLSGSEDLLDLGFEEYLDAGGIAVVEWADRLTEPPVAGLRLRLEHAGGDRRRLTVASPDARFDRLLTQLQRRWQEKECER